MLERMVPARFLYFDIFLPIIGFDSIRVMDLFTLAKPTPKFFFSDKAMFVNVTPHVS